VFDLHGTQRLIEWKNIRNSLETDTDPLGRVAELWSRAPFVNPYLDPADPSTWPDPWHLVLDLKLDDLAICLGMLYTIKLTQRFMDTECEIHTSMLPKEFNKKFFLVVDNSHVLNYTIRSVDSLNVLNQTLTDKIWSGNKLP
jgi:hypothetical protein